MVGWEGKEEEEEGGGEPECSTCHKFPNPGGAISTKICPISNPGGTILTKNVILRHW